MHDNPPELDEAIAQHRQGQVAEAAAVYRAFTESHPDLAEPWHLLGVVEMQHGRPEQAAALFREALARDGAHVKCLTNLGGALYQLNRLEEAEAVLRTALAHDGGYGDAHFNLGNVLIGRARLDEALAEVLEVLRLNPRHARAHVNAAVLYSLRNDHARAVDHAEQALALAPGDFTALVNLAWSAERLNRVERARAAIDEALGQRPDDPQANLTAAQVDLRDKQPERALARLRIALAAPLGDQDRAHALFTQAQAFEALGQSDPAFEAFTQGNAVERALAGARGVDPSRYLARLDDARARLEAGPIEPGPVERAAGAPEDPVFFVGFPRSGTTLFEQMLASHPGLVTTNEVSPLVRALREVDQGQSANALDAAAVRELRARFWDAAADIVGPLAGRRLVDTSPLNFRLLDFAQRLFPEARVLVILRDPRDVCLSAFMQQFSPTEELANFTTLDGAVAVYERLMGLWQRQKEVMGLPWLEFRYEDLVRDMEGVTRGVLDFLSLEWSDAVLAYRAKASEGAIVTPSYRQVGEALHTRACGRWQRYRRHLAPHLDRLAPFVAAYGYAEDEAAQG